MSTNFNKIEKFRFWCQKVLPLVYDDSLSYYETLCKITNTLNEVIENINNIPGYISELLSEEELKNILGTLLNQLEEQIASANEKDSETATDNRNVGDMIWLNGLLYRAIKQIVKGDKYVVDSNVEKITIEDLYKEIQLTFCSYVENSSTNASKDISEGTWFWYKNKLCLATKDISQGTSFVDNTNYVEINVFGQLKSEIENAVSPVKSEIENVKKGSYKTPENYGAVGDGITDDTEAVQNCLNENTISYFDKPYLVTKLTLPNGHTIYGGDDVGVILTTGSIVMENVSTINNIKIYNMDNYSNENYAIVMGSFCKLNNVFIDKCKNGVSVEGSNGALKGGCFIDGLHIERCSGNGFYGSYMNDVYMSNSIINNSPDGSTQSNTGNAIKLRNFVQALSVANSSFLQSNHSLDISNDSGYVANNSVGMIYFTQCWFDSASIGAYLNRARNVTFTGCWFADRPNNCIYMSESDGVTITGCNFDSCDTHGINIFNSRNVEITGSSFRNIGGSAIYVNTASRQITIVGNWFGNSSVKDLDITLTKWLTLVAGVDQIIVTNNFAYALQKEILTSEGLVIINNNLDANSIIGSPEAKVMDVRFNTVTNKLQYCNGTTWIDINSF